MVIKTKLILILFLCASVYAQKNSALKVFVTAAETNSNILNAKVTLEGYGIAALTGKFNKKEKYYYFDSIPAGYNTVMVYHKKYNEKGFQDTRGLPNSITLSLHDKKNIYYRFLDGKSPYHDYLIWDTYVEDPFKIIIRPETPMGYNEFKDFILRKIEELQLNIEFVNPFYEDMKLDLSDANDKEPYPYISETDAGYTRVNHILPVLDGGSTLLRDIYIQNICVIFRKKDGSKFNRFNDPVIKVLKDQGLDVYSILLIKNNREDPYSVTDRKSFKIRDKKNKEYNRKHAIDSSRFFFYRNYFPNTRKPLRLFKKESGFVEFEIEPFSPDFIAILNDNYKIPESTLWDQETEFRKLKSMPPQERSIGLGILDLYEYYSTIHN